LIKNQYANYKSFIYEINNVFIPTNDEINKNFYNLINLILNSFLENFNYEEYHKITILKTNSNINAFKTEIYESIELENVIYENKTFYDNEKKELCINEIKNDYEMKHFKKREYLKNKTYIKIENNVVILDYIYDHYNFGEFVDVLKRLIYLKKTNNLSEMMTLEKKDVKNIEYYFEKFDLKLNCNKINWNKNDTFQFKKCYLNVCKSNISRNFVSATTRFFINKLFNPFQCNVNLKYKLFLSRGSGKRFSINSEYFYAELMKRNFIFLNGSESLDTIQKYFTNACIIVGEHGSLLNCLPQSLDNICHLWEILHI